MYDDIGNIQYSLVRNYPYEQFFREVQYNGKLLSATERKEFVSAADGTIAEFTEGLPMTKGILEDIKDKHDEFHEIQRTIVSVMHFVLITMIDSIVISKYFIIADKDYDKRFMRGKMTVLLNEGFKKLYGFDENTRKKSEWNRLAAILKYFPENIRQQYNQLSSLLKKHSESSSWWREERNVETHLDAGKLYDSRCEDVEESKVMMDSQKLYNALFAVYVFLAKMHVCLNNFLVDKYRRGELREE